MAKLTLKHQLTSSHIHNQVTDRGLGLIKTVLSALCWTSLLCISSITHADWQKELAQYMHAEKKLAYLQSLDPADKAPQDLFSYQHALAKTLRRSGDNQGALAIFNQLLDTPDLTHDNLYHLYYSLNRLYFQQQAYQEADHWIEKALQFSEGISQIVPAILAKSGTYLRTARYDTGIAAIQAMLKQYSIPQNSPLRIDIYHNLALFYENKEFYNTALYYKLKAYRLLKLHDTPEKDMANYYYELGVSYKDLQQYQKSLQALHKALVLDEQSGIKNNIAYTHVFLSASYLFNQQFFEAITHAKTATTIFKSLGSIRDTHWAQYNLAHAYFVQGEVAKAHQLIKDTFDFFKQTPSDLIPLINCHLLMGKILSLLHPDDPRGLAILKKGLALTQQNQLLNSQHKFLQAMVAYFQARTDFANALSYQQAITEVNTLLLKRHRDDNMAKLQYQLVQQEKEQELQTLILTQAKNKQAIAAQTSLLLLLLLAIISIVVIILVGFVHFKQKQRLVEQHKRHLQQNITQKSEFLAQMSMSLRIPLDTLQRRTQHLKRQLAAPSNTDYSALFHDIQQLNQLISDIHLNAFQQLSVESSLQSFNDFAHHLQQQAHLLAAERPFRMSLQLDNDYLGEFDGKRLEQAFFIVFDYCLQHLQAVAHTPQFAQSSQFAQWQVRVFIADAEAIIAIDYPEQFIYTSGALSRVHDLMAHQQGRFIEAPHGFQLRLPVVAQCNEAPQPPAQKRLHQ